MKHIVSIIVFFLVLGSYAQAQSFYSPKRNKAKFNIEVSNMTTRSVYGWSTGFVAGIDINNRMSVSYVNLVSIENDEHKGRAFRGAQYQYFFNPKRKFNIGLGLVVGLYNEQFLSAVPSVEMRYLIGNRVVVGFGLSRVETYPKFDFKLGFRLFK